MIMILQCRFINSTKCITLVRVCVHVWGQETYGNSLDFLLNFAVHIKKCPPLGIMDLLRTMKILCILIWLHGSIHSPNGSNNTLKIDALYCI